jgi:hypothetical protein
MRMCLLLLLLTYLLTRPGLPLPLSAEGDSWGAAVRYALLAEQGNPSAALNLAWLLHRRGAAHSGPPNHHVLALPLWLRAAGRRPDRKGQAGRNRELSTPCSMTHYLRARLEG